MMYAGPPARRAARHRAAQHALRLRRGARRWPGRRVVDRAPGSRISRSACPRRRALGTGARRATNSWRSGTRCAPRSTRPSTDHHRTAAVLDAINGASACAPCPRASRGAPAPTRWRPPTTTAQSRADIVVGAIAADAIDLLTGPRRARSAGLRSPGLRAHVPQGPPAPRVVLERLRQPRPPGPALSALPPAKRHVEITSAIVETVVERRHLMLGRAHHPTAGGAR